MTSYPKLIQFATLMPYTRYSFSAVMSSGTSVAILLDTGFIDSCMASNGVTPGINIHWKESGVDKIGFSGVLSLAMPANIIHPDTAITEFLIMPLGVNTKLGSDGGQGVDLFLYELYE